MLLSKFSNRFTALILPILYVSLECGIFGLILAGLNLLICRSLRDAAYIAELTATSSLLLVLFFATCFPGVFVHRLIRFQGLV